jgi:peroxiredoxin (alkyl hydroperoxide reductase subunit C)
MPTQKNKTTPSVTWQTMADNKWVNINSDDIFKNKTVIAFSLPGAFTPTCSSSHLPRYNELAEVFKQHGVDQIICISVNDTFVMNSWAKDQESEQITMIPDGNGYFTEQMGMLVDKSDIGFGKRSWRYSMLVKNGVIDKIFVEPDVEGDPFEVSDADTMLDYINANAKKPSVATILTKPDCPFCKKAKKALTKAKINYEEITVSNKGITSKTLRAIANTETVPQIFIDGKHIGGSAELDNYLKG